jgi:ABC-type amino acid transport substrate-binding protein
MRGLGFALVISLLTLAFAPAAATARGPEKNDSLNGQGFILAANQTAEISISAHTISSTTTAATGNMSIKIVTTDTVTGDVSTNSYWADVYCLSVLGGLAQVNGNVYRAEPDLAEPMALSFEVTDTGPSTLPDRWDGIFTALFTPCAEPTGGIIPIDKGDFKVNDE